MPKVDIILKGRYLTVDKRLGDGLVTLGSAEYAKPTYKTRVMKAENNETAELRAEYEAVFGKKPFMGWDSDILKAKIADGKAQSAPTQEQHSEGADVPYASDASAETDSSGASDNG